MLNLKWNTKSALYMQYQFGCRLNMWNQNKNTLYLFELNGDESGKNYGIAYNVDWVIRNGFVFELHILKIAPHRQWNSQQTTPNQNSNRVESEMEQHINNTKKLVHLNNSLSIVLQPVHNVWTVIRMSKYFILHDIVTYSHGLFWHFSFVVVWVFSAHSQFFVGYFWFGRNPSRAHFQYYCYYFVTLALIQILYSIDVEIYDMIFPCIRRCFDANKAYHSASISMGFHRAHKWWTLNILRNCDAHWIIQWSVQFIQDVNKFESCHNQSISFDFHSQNWNANIIAARSYLRKTILSVENTFFLRSLRLNAD